MIEYISNNIHNWHRIQQVVRFKMHFKTFWNIPRTSKRLETIVPMTSSLNRLTDTSPKALHWSRISKKNSLKRVSLFTNKIHVVVVEHCFFLDVLIRKANGIHCVLTTQPRWGVLIIASCCYSFASISGIKTKPKPHSAKRSRSLSYTVFHFGIPYRT